MGLPGKTGSYPVIFIYTSYGAKKYMELIQMVTADDPMFGHEARTIFGYVCADVRGRNENAFEPYPGRSVVGSDGADIVNWIAAQPWSNRKIGMWGSSSDGINQYSTAAECPPALTAIAPCVARLVDNYAHYYPGGVLEEAYVTLLDEAWPGSWQRVTQHPRPNSYWQEMNDTQDIPALKIDVPVLLISGWWDHNVDFSFHAYKHLKEHSARCQYATLVVGPWSHYYIGRLNQGHKAYPAAENINKIYGRRFFDYWLREKQNGFYDEGSVYYFQLGDDAWVNSLNWPPPVVKEEKYYLQASGVLSGTQPGKSESDRYTHDPQNPSPSIGGPVAGPSSKFPNIIAGPAYQDEVIAGRNDYLIYDTGPLARELKVVGAPVFKAYLQCDRPDADIAIRLCDYDPETGKTLLVMPGIKRLRYRSSWTEPSWMEPGEIYSVAVEIDPIAYTWKKGHRLRLLVTSSIYPLYAVNPGNKNDFVWEDGAPQTATINVYHDSSHPSCLVLPAQMQVGL
ncbi:MAG: CocE/NonD family hydrolase [Dehalococcoidia bacterium]|nr:CocE/NonD family hydrolase [Dehalococcoidia bacterium]